MQNMYLSLYKITCGDLILHLTSKIEPWIEQIFQMFMFRFLFQYTFAYSDVAAIYSKLANNTYIPYTAA